MDEMQRREAIARLYGIIRQRKAEDLEAIHTELAAEIEAQQDTLSGGATRQKRGGRDRAERGGLDR
jgi:hypothetical protein